MTEWFVWLGTVIADWFIGLFPSWDVPPEIISFADTVNGFTAGFSGLGVWAPWPLVIICATSAVVVWGIALVIKAMRALLAHFPMIGGAG